MKVGGQYAGFHLEEELGRGTSGVVFRATDRTTGEVVALKVLLSGAEASATETERFRREALAAARLDHPGIAGIHRYGQEQGLPYLAVRYVEGETLARALGRRGAFPAHTAAQILLHLAEALQHAHERGVLHRDIKPLNIMLDAEGDPVLTDFGLARLERVQAMTQAGQLVGTPAYAAPEQLAGEAVDHRADVYSLGATLFELMTGRPPFVGASNVNLVTAVLTQEAPTPSSLSGEVDPHLEAICLTCLAKDPSARYESAWDLAEALRDYLESGSRLERRGLPWPIWVGLLAALTGAAGLVWVATRPIEPPPAKPTPITPPVVAPTPRPIASTSASPPPPAPTPTPTPTPVFERWEALRPVGGPSARGHGALVTDVGRGVAVLFGGRDATSYFDDTWEWDGRRWTEATTPLAPPARRAHCMAYDVQRQRVVLFGGSEPRAYLGDTWEWDGQTWVRIRPVGRVPRPRSHAALAYAGDGKVLLFGGRGMWNGKHTPLADTWSWDGVSWTPLVSPRGMRGRRNHGMAFDEGRSVVVLFGGRLSSGSTDETWEWKGGWRQRRPRQNPGARRVPNAMTYDPLGRRVLLFGGNASKTLMGDTWSWDGEQWRRLSVEGPAPRDWTHVTHEPVTGRVLLFGGDTGDDQFVRELWAYRSRRP